MKATIDIDDALYRRLKVEAARRGRTVRDLVADGVRRVLDAPDAADPEPAGGPPPWFGALRHYTDNAGGAHDLAAVRRSLAAGRARPVTLGLDTSVALRLLVEAPAAQAATAWTALDGATDPVTISDLVVGERLPGARLLTA